MAVSGHLRFNWPEHPGHSAEALIRSGRFAEALAEIDSLIAAQPQSTKFLRIKHQALMGLRRFDEAAAVIARALELRPDNPHYRKLQAIAVKDSGDFVAALPLLEAVHGDNPDDLDVLAALGVVHFRLGDEATALRFGQCKLDLLVAAAPDVADRDMSARQPGSRNVVSFSLWGQAPQYCNGALLNAERVPETLPGWGTRFYVDSSVPAEVVTKLLEFGAEVVDAIKLPTPVPPLMRRFLIHDDPDVELYLIRDSDSRIGPREIAAVADWQASGAAFHAIRDHPFHTELIQGGLWGGTARHEFRMSDLLGEFRERYGADRRYGADQYFLARYVWPLIRNDLLTHDSYYRTPGSRAFPDGSRGTDQDHVGMGIVLKDPA